MKQIFPHPLQPNRQILTAGTLTLTTAIHWKQRVAHEPHLEEGILCSTCFWEVQVSERENLRQRWLLVIWSRRESLWASAVPLQFTRFAVLNACRLPTRGEFLSTVFSANRWFILSHQCSSRMKQLMVKTTSHISTNIIRRKRGPYGETHASQHQDLSINVWVIVW
jgi:hypothetical protein